MFERGFERGREGRERGEREMGERRKERGEEFDCDNIGEVFLEFSRFHGFQGMSRTWSLTTGFITWIMLVRGWRW